MFKLFFKIIISVCCAAIRYSVYKMYESFISVMKSVSSSTVWFRTDLRIMRRYYPRMYRLLDILLVLLSYYIGYSVTLTVLYFSK